MKLEDTIIETTRLVLQPISEVYAEDMFNEFDFELTKYMCPAPPVHIDDTLDFVADAKDKLIKGTSYQCVVLLASTNEFIGCAGIHNLNTVTPELGLWVKRSQQKKDMGKRSSPH